MPLDAVEPVRQRPIIDLRGMLDHRRDRVAIMMGLLPLVGALAGAFPVVWKAWQRCSSLDFGVGGWRLASAVLLGWAAQRLGRRLAEGFRSEAFTSWWDPSSVPDGDLTWDDLGRLVRPRSDPIENAGSVRPRIAWSRTFRMAVTVIAMFACGRLAAEWVALPELPTFLTLGGERRLGPDALINLSGNLTAFLALIAAAASLWFANSQLRSKVRADNRQEWLANARTLLGDVVALAREHAAADAGARAGLNELLDPRRLRFELMLNPREKDHRLLMHLLRRLAFLHDLRRADAADGGAFLKVLRDHCRRSDEHARADGGCSAYDVAWKPIVECDDVAELTTYVMRLGHVVLKREWERVKAAR